MENKIIITYSGHRVDPLDMTDEDIDIIDIAHSLAYQCRYNGHTREHYSVAQHSVYVARYLGHKKFSNKLVLAALLHDANEAYLGDMVRPIKAHFAEFDTLGDILQTRIWGWAGLYPESKDVGYITAVDSAIITNEATALFSETAIMRWPLKTVGLPLHFRITPWDAEKAKANFLEFYTHLQNAIIGGP